MKNFLALCLLLLPALGSAAGPACGTPDAAAAFRSLSEFKPVFVSKPLPKTRAESAVSLSGNLDLSGNVYVPNDSGYAHITLHGRADVWDASGKIRSGSTAVSYSGSVLVSNGWIQEQIYPSYVIQVSKDGRNVGEARVSADVFLSGHVSNHWIYLSARAPLSGTITLRD